MTKGTSLREKSSALRRAIIRRFPGPIRNQLYDLKDLYRFKTGKVSHPPPIVKQRTVRKYARQFKLKVLIETGTYRGLMIEKTARHFETIYSIELDPILWAEAARRFAQHSHVHIMQGDSGRELAAVVKNLSSPALFWLDAHYSGGTTARGAEDTPVVAELISIMTHPSPGHVVLIDDARHFTGKAGYPTLDEIRGIVTAHRPNWVLDLSDDIIRIHGPRVATSNRSSQSRY
jgi:hypothetical protein